MIDLPSKTRWKGPTIQQIAELSGVGTASVDRVLNNRAGVREVTRKRVLAALEKLNSEKRDGPQSCEIRLFCESGEAFNQAVEQAAAQLNRSEPGMQLTCHFVSTDALVATQFARRFEEEGAQADGAIIVAREHPAINRAVRKLVGSGVPVVCLTTDLPSSRRSVYVGNDQYAAGSVAAQLIGRALPEETRNHILLVMSVPFRSQQEREMGFRRVLRSEFPHLKIEERLISDDRPATTHRQMMKYLAANGHPAAVYNVAGANRGVALALEEAGIADRTIFVGHELTRNSRLLLESGVMDYVISHNFYEEVRAAVRWISNWAEGTMSSPTTTQILVHTKYNCDL
ncbi:LacI family DNA-binding transcriptional regulator [Antarctobacter jejuensis]|uniref:LacI family DNA-binding transcriptional regulator n=1 Tax=Antarctobacter jejuensis TaxID=1439938 RepID=UPI003FD29626